MTVIIFDRILGSCENNETTSKHAYVCSSFRGLDLHTPHTSNLEGLQVHVRRCEKRTRSSPLGGESGSASPKDGAQQGDTGHERRIGFVGQVGFLWACIVEWGDEVGWGCLGQNSCFHWFCLV